MKEREKKKRMFLDDFHDTAVSPNKPEGGKRKNGFGMENALLVAKRIDARNADGRGDMRLFLFLIQGTLKFSHEEIGNY